MAEEQKTVELQLNPNGVFNQIFGGAGASDVKEADSFLSNEDYNKLVKMFLDKQAKEKEFNEPKNKLKRAIEAKEEQRKPEVFRGLKKGFLN